MPIANVEKRILIASSMLLCTSGCVIHRSRTEKLSSRFKAIRIKDLIANSVSNAGTFIRNERMKNEWKKKYNNKKLQFNRMLLLIAF